MAVCFLTHFKSFGQVSICGDKKSSHPVDIVALNLRDSLLQTGIDTIIVYRDWIYTNGYNGYGKVIWLDKGQCFECKIERDDSSGIDKTVLMPITKSNSDSLFNFIFDNHIDAITDNPTKQDVYISHDESHFIQIVCKNKSYCYLISGLLVQFNPEHLRAKLVGMLSDSNRTGSIWTEGKKVQSSR